MTNEKFKDGLNFCLLRSGLDFRFANEQKKVYFYYGKILSKIFFLHLHRTNYDAL